MFELNGGIPFAVLLGVSLSGSLKLLADPRQLSRFYALRNEAEVRRGKWIATIGLAIVLGCLFPVGIYAHLILTEVTDTDLIVPSLSERCFGVPIVGDRLSNRLNTSGRDVVDGQRATGSGIHALQKYVAPFSASSRELLWTRTAVIGFSVVAALLALNPPGDIVEITIFSGSLYAVCFFPAVVFGLVLAARLGAHRALVNGGWHINPDGLDCLGFAAGPSRGIPGPAALHAHLLPPLKNRAPPAHTHHTVVNSHR